MLMLISGCSFQATRPAPVVSLSNDPQPSIGKGSIRTSQYRVKKGDTLYSIAWGADKNFQEVAQLNDLKEPYTIYPGQLLSLSYKKTPTKPSTGITSQPPKKKVDKKQSTNNVRPKSNAQKPLEPKDKAQYSEVKQQSVNKVNQSASTDLKIKQWYWPAKGRVIGHFSATEQGRNGIKIAGKRGEPITAAAAGRVVYAGSALRGYGNLVIIKHNDDYLSAYAHAEKITVKEKQFVKAGQMVATMGSSGTNKVMLHFEIRYHGKSVNPLNFLPKH